MDREDLSSDKIEMMYQKRDVSTNFSLSKFFLSFIKQKDDFLLFDLLLYSRSSFTSHRTFATFE